MARSYSNPTFQAIYAYRTESDQQEGTTTARGCLRCHAPLGFPYQDLTGERAETREGVSCDFCHRVAEVNERSTHLHVAKLSTSGVIYGPAGGIDSPAHPTRKGTVFADSSLCAYATSIEVPMEFRWKTPLRNGGAVTSPGTASVVRTATCRKKRAPRPT